MGATQSTRPKVLVYGAPHAGKKSLVKALGNAEFELFTTDDGADADVARDGARLDDAPNAAAHGGAALKRVLRHLCDMSDVSASILAPPIDRGASASLP